MKITHSDYTIKDGVFHSYCFLYFSHIFVMALTIVTVMCPYVCILSVDGIFIYSQQLTESQSGIYLCKNLALFVSRGVCLINVLETNILGCCFSFRTVRTTANDPDISYRVHSHTYTHHYHYHYLSHFEGT